MTAFVAPDPARRRREAAAPGGVLLATDLGPASTTATDRALDLAARLDVPLLVVSVIDMRRLRLPSGQFSARVDQVRSRREVSAQELAQRCRGRGVAVRFLVWEGDPGESIVEAAAAEGAELIVVGTHGRGNVGRLVMGSVSEYVLRHATCPVVVVRPTGDRGLEPESGSAA
ncbi:MAG: universal stress protein [Chloroflexota bacterium]